MTHDELVNAAANWLRKKKRLPVVIQDVHCSMVSEQPDVIGWTNWGGSILVECKVSMSDFVRDSTKSFRRRPDQGMGLERYYAFPAGFVDSYPRAKGTSPYVHTLCPRGWGIVEFDARARANVLLKPVRFEKWNERCERALLVSVTRKATEGWGRRTFGEIAPPMVDGDPHPTATKIIRELREENFRFRARLRELDRAAEVARHPLGR